MNEIVEGLPFAALGQNIFDAEWDEPAELFKPYEIFERGGVKIAVIGQAFPYMPIANPGWMFPEYSFGIRDEHMQEMVDEVRAAGCRTGRPAQPQRFRRRQEDGRRGDAAST